MSVLSSPGNHTAHGAYVSPVVPFCHSCGLCPTIGRVPASANSRPSHIVAAHHNLLYIVLYEPFNNTVARFGVALSVFIGAGNDQTTGFCCRLKSLIVVRLRATAAVLDMEHFGVVLVAHLM